MTRRALRAPHLAVLAVLALTVAGCSAIDPATAHQGSAAPKPSAPPLISRQLQVAEHLVTQEGLAIALASNVLQTQLQLVSDSSTDTPTMTCTPLTGGGAKKITSRTGTTARVLSDVTYYDTGCARPYLTATATENEVGATDNLTASVTYTGPTGAALGRLATTAHATYTDAGLALEGTGIFTRKSGGPVSLGLACQSASDTLLNCEGGVSQDFVALGHSFGSITPLSLTVGQDVSTPITFHGNATSTSVGPLGALSITSPDGAHLAVAGATVAPGTPTTSGQAGGFVLFPPTPTGWTITDTASDVSFAISVVDNTTRALTGTITQVSTKRQLAAFTVDQSGTGAITYLGQKAAAIISWTLTQ